MITALFLLWLIGAAKTVIDDYETTLSLGFTNWVMIFSVAAAWFVIDGIYVFNEIKKRF